MKKVYMPGKLIMLTLILMLNISFATAVPVITSFTPSSGTVGTTIIISGSGFNTIAANNVVYFGPVRATVTASNSTLISVTVPAGATYQKISVTNLVTGLTAYSPTPFIPKFDCGGKIETSSFAVISDFQTTTNIQDAALGDFDSDGKTDLAVANYYSNSVSLYRNLSTTEVISFGPKTDYSTGTNPDNISVGDMDGDGKPDLVLANKNSNTVSILRNTSSGGVISFAARIDLVTGIKPRDISIDDFNGDGKPDIAIACCDSINTGNVSVLMNTSTPGAISFAGKVDVVADNGTDCIATCDLDGDGKSDIVVTNLNSNTFSIYRNTCTNGTIDASSFAAKVSFSTSENPYGVAIGDFDGDGKPDLAIAKSPTSSAVSVFKNKSTTGTIAANSFAAKVDFPLSSCPNSIFVSDIDGDGKPDIAVTFYEYGKIALFRNTATTGVINSGSFATRVEYTTGSISSDIDIGDLNQDGKPELTISNSNEGVISILQNQIMTCPTISSITPESAGKGEVVTITGTNLSEVVSVSFGGVTATSFEVISSTSIKAVVGSGATGTVSVTSYYGTGTYEGFKFRDVQSISFNALTSKTYGDADFDPGATASSSLTVAYSSSNTSVATIVSDKVHITGVGTCTIYADQPGSDYYMPAEQASQSLKVNKKELTVTGATVVSKVYDANTNAVLTGAVLTGKVGSDDVTLENATYGVFATPNAGTDITVTTSMSITGTLSGNYTLTQPSLKGNITAKEITVTPNTGQRKVYGETDPVLTYTFSPALLGTDAISGKMSRVSGENAGAYNYSQGTLTAGSNYVLSVATGAVFSITTKPVTITADAGQYKIFGKSDPVLIYRVSPSLISGDSFTGSLSRVAGENTGNYAITIGTLSAGSNYDVTFVSADFTILPTDNIPPVVTFPNITGRASVHIYDQPVINFSETVIQLVSEISDGIILREGGETGTNIPFTIVSSNLSSSTTLPEITISADFKCGTTYYLAIIAGSFSDRAENLVALSEVTFITDAVPDKPVIYGASEDVMLCPFTVLTCSNAASGMTYIWQKDGVDLNTTSATEYAMPENASGIYNLKVIDNVSTCQNKSNDVTVSEYSIVKPVIYEKKKSGVISILIVDNTSKSFETYKWTYANGSALPSGIADENQFLVLNSSYMNGEYMVTTTDVNGCQNTSDSKSVSLKDAVVTLYPSVNSGSFKISFFHPENGNVIVRIINATGGVVKELSYSKTDVNEIFDIDLTNVKSGVYLVELKMNDFTNVSQVVISR